MGFFAKLKRDKEDQQWLEGADFTECLELLFEGTPDEDMKRRLFLLQCSKKRGTFRNHKARFGQRCCTTIESCRLKWISLPAILHTGYTI